MCGDHSYEDLSILSSAYSNTQLTGGHSLTQIPIHTHAFRTGKPASVKIGTIQRRLAWPLRKDDTQNREVPNFLKFLMLTRPDIDNLRCVLYLLSAFWHSSAQTGITGTRSNDDCLYGLIHRSFVDHPSWCLSLAVDICFKEETNEVHPPGIEPGSPAWKADIIPLDHECLCFRCNQLFAIKSANI
ncbi:hypothetical protein PROFUN_13899 [Planoprotostelium fungivorum]|uniref:Uncharacterized protein n=1 Tax=Planoprotostelium fungivorum TaxID=1890364 RepID=A0A2P6N2T4_9EUKA|nr:hypothetical protein PROFUN_13899 [Planoprotostelium fungivorum]